MEMLNVKISKRFYGATFDNEVDSVYGRHVVVPKNDYIVQFLVTSCNTEP